MWDVFKQAASAWNEEIGEISLSHLSRLTTADTAVSDVSHMSDMYCLQGLRQNFMSDIIASRIKKSRGGQRLLPTDILVKRTVGWLHCRIDRLELGLVDMYIGDPSDWDVQSRDIEGKGDEKVVDWSLSYHPVNLDTFITHSLFLIRRSEWTKHVDEKAAKQTMVQF